jgi:hypothetical protein
MTATTHSTFALLEPIDHHQHIHVTHIEDLSQFSGYGYTASGTARRLRELLENPEKFKVFAFISCLLCPNAGEQFRRVRKHQEFRTKHNQRTGRELKRGKIANDDFHKRLDHITSIAEDSWWYPNASIKSISSEQGLGPPPQWIQRQWIDDTPLNEMYAVPCVSRLVTADDFAILVKEFGYDPRAAWTSITHAQLQPPPDRRRRVVRPDLSEQEGDEEREYNGAGFAQPFPYVAAPARRTEQGCGFTRRQVSEVVDKMRIDSSTRRAVTKIVYARLPLKTVAKAYHIPWQTLKTYAQRARLRLRTNHQ